MGSRQTGKAVGVVRFYTKVSAGRVEVKPSLLIRPAMEPQHFEEMLADLKQQIFGCMMAGMLAEDRGSFSGSSRPRRGPERPLYMTIERSRDLIEVWKLLERHLMLIERNPSRVIRRDPMVISRTRARLLNYKMLPGPSDSRSVRALVPEESTDTPEQDLVDSIRWRLGVEADMLAKHIRRRIMEQERMFERDEKSSSTASWNDAVRDAGEICNELDRVAIRQRGVKSSQANHEPSNRALLSNEYGPPILRWLEYQQRWPSQFMAGRGPHAILDEKSVAPSWLLFQRWVLVRLYAALLDAGFVPRGEKLTDKLSVKNGIVEFGNPDTERRWVLEWRPDQSSPLPNGKRLAIEIDYECSIGGLQPDILLSVRKGDSPPKSYVIDAKYRPSYADMNRGARDYRAGAADPLEPFLWAEFQHYRSYLRVDRLGTIRDKYLKELGIEAGFVVHCDPNGRAEVWDDAIDRGADVASDNGGGTVESIDDPHRSVATSWLPGTRGLGIRIAKLLNCIFAFHEGLTEVCWHCGSEGRLQRRDRTSGKAYRCVGCGAYWKSVWCHGDRSHSPLLKMGERSFQRVKRGSMYNVHCPWCKATLDEFAGSWGYSEVGDD